MLRHLFSSVDGLASVVMRTPYYCKLRATENGIRFKVRHRTGDRDDDPDLLLLCSLMMYVLLLGVWTS